MSSLARDRLMLARRTAGAFAVVPWLKVWLRHVLAGLALGGLVFAMHIAASFVPLREYGAVNLVHTAVSDLLGALCILLAVAGADHAKGGVAGDRAIYVLAVLVGAATWAALEYAGFRAFGVGVRWYSAVPYQYTGVEEAAWRTVYGFLEWLLIGGAATFVYLDARRARIEQGRLRRAEIERALTAKRMLESQLQAMQARVEPQFLFDTMAQVRRLYDVDRPLAERMLDELIAYLRAAMPQIRDTTSTVHREMELARAYLDILRLPLGERLQVLIEVRHPAGHGRMPPMMLLPLFDQSVAEHRDSRRPQGKLAIVCEVIEGRLRISIADSGAGLVSATSPGRIADASERLAALYGTAAKLEPSRVGEEATRVVLEIPFDPADDSPVRAGNCAPAHPS
jgi:hypothetical protein